MLTPTGAQNAEARLRLGQKNHKHVDPSSAAPTKVTEKQMQTFLSRMIPTVKAFIAAKAKTDDDYGLFFSTATSSSEGLGPITDVVAHMDDVGGTARLTFEFQGSDFLYVLPERVSYREIASFSESLPTYKSIADLI